MKTKIVITGSRKYISYLAKHLRKEHPSTKNKLKVVRRR